MNVEFLTEEERISRIEELQTLLDNDLVDKKERQSLLQELRLLKTKE